jgi:hypothetical protein
VTIRLSPVRSSHVPQQLDIPDRRRCPVPSLAITRCDVVVPVAVRSITTSHARTGMNGVSSARVPRTRVLRVLGRRIQAIQRSPYRSVLAPSSWRDALLLNVRSLPAMCPLVLSDSGKKGELWGMFGHFPTPSLKAIHVVRDMAHGGETRP